VAEPTYPRNRTQRPQPNPPARILDAQDRLQKLHSPNLRPSPKGLARRTNLLDTESVKSYLANAQLSENRKTKLLEDVSRFCAYLKIPFTRPRYKRIETLPFNARNLILLLLGMRHNTGVVGDKLRDLDQNLSQSEYITHYRRGWHPLILVFLVLSLHAHSCVRIRRCVTQNIGRIMWQIEASISSCMQESLR
jgi:hypothetical protein